MDPASVSLIIGLVAQGVGVAREIGDLALRVQAGETITDAEVETAERSMAAAIERWNEAAEDDHK